MIWGGFPDLPRHCVPMVTGTRWAQEGYRTEHNVCTVARRLWPLYLDLTLAISSAEGG